jgi:hypothetical protein
MRHAKHSAGTAPRHGQLPSKERAMAASNEWTEWYLTPRGWEAGDEKTEFAPVKSQPTPVDRVLTLTYKEVSNGYGPVHLSRQEIWRISDNDAIVALVAAFGDAPKSL